MGRTRRVLFRELACSTFPQARSEERINDAHREHERYGRRVRHRRDLLSPQAIRILLHPAPLNTLTPEVATAARICKAREGHKAKGLQRLDKPPLFGGSARTLGRRHFLRRRLFFRVGSSATKCQNVLFCRRTRRLVTTSSSAWSQNHAKQNMFTQANLEVVEMSTNSKI